MKNAFFGGWVLAASALVLAFASCGGKVVVDGTGDGGEGGSGAAASSSSQDATVGPGTSSSVGPGPGPGPGPTTTVTTGVGGGAPSAQCVECLEDVAEATCARVLETCEAAPSCFMHFDCLAACGYTYECEESCVMKHGTVDLYMKVVSCAVCEACAEACLDFSLSQYCVVTP